LIIWLRMQKVAILSQRTMAGIRNLGQKWIEICPPNLSTCLRKCPLRKKSKNHFPSFSPATRPPHPFPSTSHLLPHQFTPPRHRTLDPRPACPATNHCATQADEQGAFFCSYIPRPHPPKMSRKLRKCPLLSIVTQATLLIDCPINLFFRRSGHLQKFGHFQKVLISQRTNTVVNVL